MNKTVKSLTRNISSVAVVQFANYAIPMIIVPIVVRIIGPDKFGIINFANSIIAYFTLLINYGFNITATRKIAQHRYDYLFITKVFNDVLLAKILLFLAVLIIFLSCLFVIPVFKKYSIVFASTFIICIAWVLTPDWFFQGVEDLHRVAIFNCFAKLLSLILVLVTIKKSEDYYWQALSLSFAQIFVAAVAFIWAIKKYHLKVQLKFWKNAWKLIYEDRIMFFSTVVVNLYTSTNILILGILTNEFVIGYYSAAQKLVILMQSLVLVPITQAFFPFIANAFSTNIESGIKKVRTLAVPVVIITFTASIVLFVSAPFLITTLFGSKFQPSIRIFRIIAFLPFVISISNIYGIQLMVNLHYDKAFLKITSIGAFVSLFLNFILVNYFAAYGSAIAWLLTELFITCSTILFVKKIGIVIISKKSFSISVIKKDLRPVFVSMRTSFSQFGKK